MQRYPELAGKVAVITGAGRKIGIGAAIAHRLAEEGCKIVVHDRGHVEGEADPTQGLSLAQEMEQVAQSIRDAGGECITITGDLMVEAEVKAIVDKTVEAFGRLDIWVNNAGIGFLSGMITDFSQTDWDAVMGVNLRAPFFGMKHAGAQMIAQGSGGRIISIASQASKSAFSRMAAYVASKHGLVGLTRTAALEFGQHGITVNAVCPNHVPTDLGNWQRVHVTRKRTGGTDEQYWENLKSRVPLQRPGSVQDSANACAFLCSDQASYMTGEAMNVSGGEEYH